MILLMILVLLMASFFLGDVYFVGLLFVFMIFGVVFKMPPQWKYDSLQTVTTKEPLSLDLSNQTFRIGRKNGAYIFRTEDVTNGDEVFFDIEEIPIENTS